jgi:hypothetical protein
MLQISIVERLNPDTEAAVPTVEKRSGEVARHVFRIDLNGNLAVCLPNGSCAQYRQESQQMPASQKRWGSATHVDTGNPCFGIIRESLLLTDEIPLNSKCLQKGAVALRTSLSASGGAVDTPRAAEGNMHVE